jgi:flagellar hook protein FlgE
MSTMSIAAAGMQSGLTRFDSANQNLNKAFDGSSNADPAGAIVDQVTASEQVQASAAVVGASDRMLKQLLDITV